MFQHRTESTIESSACLGVAFTLKRVTEGMRLEISAVVTAEMKSRNIQHDSRNPLDSVAVDALLNQVNCRTALVDVTGLMVDGDLFDGLLRANRPSALERFLASAPAALVREISLAVQKDFGLTGDESKNSAPLSGTSSGNTGSGMSAAPASGPDPGGSGIAAAIIPAQ